MKKDGIAARMKASMLTIREDAAVKSAEESNVDNQNSHGRVVSDVRLSCGQRGVPKSGRIWKRMKSQRYQ